MKVIFFHRKPVEGVYFSIENLFQYIRSAMPADVECVVKVMRFHSKGFFKRLYSCFESAFNQGDVNHITGDINFIALFLRKKKTLLTIHDVGFMQRPKGVKRILLHLFWLIIPVKRSRIITTVSQSTKNELLKYVTVESDHVHVIHVPVSPLFKPVPKSFDKKKPRILQLGTKPNKNIGRLVEALHGIPCLLEIVGRPDNSLLQQLGLYNIDYTWSGNLTNPEILEKYIASDIVAFVSTYEGFGMPIAEANAVGRVVISSNILSMPEVAGNAAHLVDPFDVSSIRSGIIKVIENDLYREDLICKGFINKKRFNVETIALQYKKIYESLQPLAR